MREVIASGIAALLAYVINSWLSRRNHLPTIAVWGPLTEEWLKSGVAWLLGAYIPLVHLWFGAVEAITDIVGPTRGFWPAMTSLVGHGLYGLITLLVMRATQSLLIGIIMACSVHIAWNYAVLSLTRRRRN